MFPSRLPIDNNQETVPLSPRPFIKTGLAAEESDSSIYIRGANMKRYRLFQNIGLLTAMSFALVSCFKDELVGSRVNSRSNIIGFGISAATTADGTPLTRATQYADSALLMLGRGGADTLYLHASSENNISALDTSVATRGVPVNSSNFSTVCKNFSVTAFTPTVAYYMKNVKVDNLANGIWSSDEEHFWPEDEEMTLDFFAYAPAVFGENQVFAEDDIQYTTSDGKKISFDYTVPGSGESVTNAAELQPDIMFAYNSQNKKNTDSATGSVPLKFYHALAGVKFVAKDITKGTVKSITLKNLFGTGTCTYTFPTDSDEPSEPSIVWTDLDDQNRSFSQEFNVTVNNQQTGEQGITDQKPETTFMMIPQNIEKAVVEILFNDGTTDYTLTGKLCDPTNDDDPKTWDAGKIYTYAISTESINWTYVFEVTRTITLKLGETSAPYTVTSYRFRTSNREEKQAVPWTSENIGATETDADPTSANHGTFNIKVNDVLSEFTYSGEGAENINGVDYALKLSTPTMHTTYPGDITLKNAEDKGTIENPYDLSTHDENGRTIGETTANCYVVDAPGVYKLPLVYGNARLAGSDNTGAYNGNAFVDYNGNRITQPYINNPHDCCLVWSDGYYMVKDVKLSDDKKYLVFTIDEDYLQQANAVVAVRDSEGKIMWSWHIWVTERKIYSENIHELHDIFGSSRIYYMMQCNLGWVDGKTVYYNNRELNFRFTQSVSGNVQEMKVLHNGDIFDYKDPGSTYYQWGRKDPLVALRNWHNVGFNDYRHHEIGKDGYQYRYEYAPVKQKIAIQNPNVFYARPAGKNCDWLDGSNPTLWDATGSDNKDLQKETSVKTVYDPSPRGFKVPVSRAFAVLVNGYTGDGDLSKLQPGQNPVEITGVLNGKSWGAVPNNPNRNQYIAYPQRNTQGLEIPLTATGQRSDRDGLLEKYDQNGSEKADVGGLWAMYGVYYQSCVPVDNTMSYCLVIRRDYPSGIEVYSYGFMGAKSMARPVRCIKDR